MGHAVTRKLGDVEVSILTDGASTFGPELFPGTDQEHIADLLAAASEETIRTNFNAVLIRTSGRTVLADAGPRNLFGPTCGALPRGLEEVGTAPEEVDTLFVTHLHPDHIAGALTAEGAAVFPNAELVVLKSELEFWRAEIPGASETLRGWQVLAQALLSAYGDRVKLIDGAGEIAPEITAMPLPGHTPGHSGYRIGSGAEQLIHVGDIVHAPLVQAADPEIAIAFDLDPDEARRARKRLLDELATERSLVTGGHFLAPAFQRVERAGNGFRLVQD